MTLTTQSDYGALVRGTGVQFREFFSQIEQQYVDQWSPVVKTITDDGAQLNAIGVSGVGVLRRFSEGASVPKLERYKLYNTAFVHKQYGGQVEVTRMAMMNRDFKAELDEFKALANAGAVLKSKAPAQIFNGAFDTTSVKNGIEITRYQDGKPLCSTIHPRVDGGSAQSNASSTGIILSEANFETARIALHNQLQDDGNPIEIAGDIYLVTTPENEKTARIITMSELRSGTTDNDVNIYKGGTYPLLISKWLNSSNGGTNTQWFLVAPNTSRLSLVIRNDLQMEQSVDKNTKSLLNDVICDMSVGHSDWRGVWGSKGDAQAYSS